jgi:Ser/Thr protein kinase RdoA (MazF antagonist)
VFELVADGVHLALRVHRPGYRAPEHIRSELAFLQIATDKLAGSPFAVPHPVPARNGQLVVCVDGLSCDVLSWIDGDVLKHGRGLGTRSTFLLGEGLARLHEAARNVDLELPRWDADAMFSDTSPFQPGSMEEFLSPPAWALFREVAERTQAVFDELGRTEGQWGVVHNDYILINCLFKRGPRGWRLGILDFDDLGWGWFLYDLAPLLGNLSDYPDAFTRLRRAFLDGYRSVRPLPAEAERHLPVLMAARHAATLTWLAAKQRRGETDIPIPRHVEIRVSEMARCLRYDQSGRWLDEP